MLLFIWLSISLVTYKSRVSAIWQELFSASLSLFPGGSTATYQPCNQVSVEKDCRGVINHINILEVNVNNTKYIQFR